MVNRELSIKEMLQMFEDAMYSKKGICVYIKGLFSKTTYFCDNLEVRDYGETIHFEDTNGLECNLQQGNIKNIVISDDDLGETIDIILDNDVKFSFMIV